MQGNNRKNILEAGRHPVSCSRTHQKGMRKSQPLAEGRGFHLLHHPAAQSAVSIHICKLLEGLGGAKGGEEV